MLRLLAVLATLVLPSLGSTIAGELSGAQISAEAQKSVVYIAIKYYDENIQEMKDGEVGTGFIVSPDGYFVTDYHVIREWLAQDAEHQQQSPIVARLGSKFGPVLDVLVAARDEPDDLALLKIRNSGTYQPANLCFAGGLQAGEAVYAFGFANGQEFTATPAGSFSNANSDDGRWEASFNNAHGMSGGPLYDRFGSVVGVIRSTIEMQNATNFVTPLLWARQMIASRTSVTERCGRDGGAKVDDGAPDTTGTGIWRNANACVSLDEAFSAADNLDTLHYAGDGAPVSNADLRDATPIREVLLLKGSASHQPQCGVNAEAPGIYCSTDVSRSLETFQAAFDQAGDELAACFKKLDWRPGVPVTDCTPDAGDVVRCDYSWSRGDRTVELYSFTSESPPVFGFGVLIGLQN